jgi:hypothetical protein
MSVTAESLDQIPHDTLLPALAIVDAWERGEINDFSPEGLAVVLHLQQARIGRTATAPEAEMEL